MTDRKKKTTPMEAGPELDALVAERVFQASLHDAAHVTYMTLPGERPVSDQRPVPNYSTDIAAAWLVMERLVALGWFPGVEMLQGADMPAIWRADLYRSAENPDNVWCDAETAPLAICRAALAVMEASNA